MEKLKELPPGWINAAVPKDWRAEDEHLPELNLQRVGYVLLPELFIWGVHAPEMNEPPSEDVDKGIMVTFAVVEHELVMRNIYGIDVDLEYWLARLIEVLPMSQWKSLATSEMTKFLVEDEHRKHLPDFVMITDAGVTLAQAKHHPARTTGSKRYKITEQHLKEVVRVYSEALERGEPPTKEVAEVFEVAHSTAAKWVGAARRKDLLPAVGGTSDRPVEAKGPVPGVDRAFTEEEAASQPRPSD